MVVQFPCKICCCPVAKSLDSIQCNKCNVWVHRECNKINNLMNYYKKMKSHNGFT